MVLGHLLNSQQATGHAAHHGARRGYVIRGFLVDVSQAVETLGIQRK